MPKTVIATTETVYFVSHNGNDILHYGSISPGSVVTSGQPFFEEFTSEELMERRAKELNPKLYEEQESNRRSI